jgi:5-methylcytosine-specific restriction endonuclease McrA
MRRLAIVLLAALSFGASWRKDCDIRIERHERHTSKAAKKEAYRRAGIPWESRSCCVVDHRIPLQLGGVDDISNLQVQTKAAGKAKDRVENYLTREVCLGQLTLGEAQRQVQLWRKVKLP